MLEYTKEQKNIIAFLNEVSRLCEKYGVDIVPSHNFSGQKLIVESVKYGIRVDDITALKPRISEKYTYKIKSDE